MTKTSSFGTARREGHDSSTFYNRSLYNNLTHAPIADLNVAMPALDGWTNQLYNQSSTNMAAIPDNSVALAFTSPPYNVGKDYENDMGLEAYLGLIREVAQEVYRVLRPGGRYIINIANLGRKPYIPLHAFFYQIHLALNFLPMGEIIWQKGKGANGSCAWGSWQSAKAPRLRDVHEYILVFAKQSYSRPDKGISTLERDEFMASTLSIWKIPPESAKKRGHPAPFPLELANRVIKLYSYQDDVILDPFMGSGTTCVAAKQLNRHYVGFDISADYCELANKRLMSLVDEAQAITPK